MSTHFEASGILILKTAALAPDGKAARYFWAQTWRYCTPDDMEHMLGELPVWAAFASDGAVQMFVAVAEVAGFMHAEEPPSEGSCYTFPGAPSGEADDEREPQVLEMRAS